VVSRVTPKDPANLLQYLLSLKQYDEINTFQVEEGFNSLGQLEVPKEVLEELIVNALIH